MPLSKIDSDSLNTPITAADLAYTGTLTGSTGIVNIGSGQVYKDASGNVGIGITSPTRKLAVSGTWTNTGDYLMDSDSPQLAWTSGDLRFKYAGLSGTEAMRINSSGNLLVGATSTSVTSSFQVKRSGGNPVAVHNNGGTSGYFNQILFLNNAGTADIGYIARTNDNSVAYNTTSDYRLKENIAPMTGALATVQLLKPVTYKWKSDGSEGQGFIAHELKAVVPDCVTGEKDAVDADGKPQYQGIDTSFLVATLTAALQELKAIVDAQGAEIAALKGTP